MWKRKSNRQLHVLHAIKWQELALRLTFIFILTVYIVCVCAFAVFVCHRLLSYVRHSQVQSMCTLSEWSLNGLDNGRCQFTLLSWKWLVFISVFFLLFIWVTLLIIFDGTYFILHLARWHVLPVKSHVAKSCHRRRKNYRITVCNVLKLIFMLYLLYANVHTCICPHTYVLLLCLRVWACVVERFIHITCIVMTASPEFNQ